MEDSKSKPPTMFTTTATRPFKQITDLPNELLKQIFHLAAEPNDLWCFELSELNHTARNLLEVCRLFVPVAAEIFYREAIMLADEKMSNVVWEDRFSNGPLATRFCRKLTIKCVKASSHVQPSVSTKRLPEILTQLPALQCLDIRAGTVDYWGGQMTNTESLEQFTRFISITSLRLSQLRSEGKFFEFVVHALPNLKRLMVKDYLDIRDVDFLSFRQRTSGIEELHLGTIGGNKASFRLFLGWFKALKKISSRKLLVNGRPEPTQSRFYRALRDYHKSTLQFFAPSFFVYDEYEEASSRDLCAFENLGVLYLSEDRVIEFAGPGPYCMISPKLHTIIIAQTQRKRLQKTENISAVGAFMNYTFHHALRERSVCQKTNLHLLQAFSKDYHSRSADPKSRLWSYSILCGSFSDAMAALGIEVELREVDEYEPLADIFNVANRAVRGN